MEEEGESGDPNKKDKLHDETDAQLNDTQDDENKTAKASGPVSILKKSKVQFKGYDEPDHPGVSYDPGITDNYSDNDEDDDGLDVPNDLRVQKRKKSAMKSRSLAGLSVISTFSGYSSVYVDPAMGALTAMVFFKIFFVDIVGSVGDNVTDFLQGFNLIFDLRKIGDSNTRPWLREYTASYGVLVLIMNWVPGIVAVIHILSFHRDEYFSARKEESNTGSDMVDAKIKKKQKARKKRYITVLILCLFFYPIVPPVVHFIVMCQMNSQQDTISFSRTQLFAGIARSISGCVESPLQLTVTLWLMMTGVIDTPLAQSSTSFIKDKFDNTLPIPEISAISMIFSLFNILTSAIQINIMSVYIGDIKNMKGFNKFINLSTSHFPFFLSSILFRVSSFAYLWVYLDTFKLLIPITLILMANLFIGLATYGMYRLPKKITRELSKIRKERRKKENNPALVKLRRNKTKSFDSPIWLNTLLSLFVPCCFVHEIDHLVVEEMKESYQKEREKILKAFQHKILRYQAVVSSSIHLFFIAIVFFGVNFRFLNHNYNIYSNTRFNIYSTVLFVQGIISLCFCWNLDVFEAFRLNEEENQDQVDFPLKEKTKKSNMRVTIQEEVEVKEISQEDLFSISMDEEDKLITKNHPKVALKAVVALMLTVLIVSPIGIGLVVATSLGSMESSYVIVKAQESNNYTLRITNAFNVNSYSNYNTITGYLDTCQDCSGIGAKSDKILMADLKDSLCKKSLTQECIKKYKAIILLETWKFKTSSPYLHKICNSEEEEECYSIENLLKEEGLPILSIREPERIEFKSIALKNKMSKNEQKIDIAFKPLFKILDQEKITDSDLFKIDCDVYFQRKKPCMNLFSTSDYYLGCKGVPRIRKEFDIICRDKGRECPEIQSWNTTLPAKSQKECEEKEGKQSPHYPPLTCRLNANKLPYIQPDVRYCKNQPFTFDHICSKDGSGYIYKTEDCSDTNCPDPDWGPWSEWSACRGNLDQDRYRFCRKSSKCVLYEWQVLEGDDCKSRNETMPKQCRN